MPKNRKPAAIAGSAPCKTPAGRQGPNRIFLLSPANIAGDRAKLILNAAAQFALARRLRETGAPLGEVFSFISGLYFRGKLAYAQAFAAPGPDLPGALVITASGGLVPPETIVTIERLRKLSAGALDPADARYHGPLARDARLVAEAARPECQIVLLGSIATLKYLTPLLKVFGERLCFPAEFIGRGDLSRGGLLLRCARAGVQLTYAPVANAIRHGPRPPRLPALPRR
jgi:hypothetical protein